MAFVDEDQLVLRKEVQEAVRALAGTAAGHVHRVVLDARAEACLAEHLEVVLDTHPDTLGFHEAVCLLEMIDAFFELGADSGRGSFHPTRGHHVLVGRIEVELLELLARLHAHGVELADSLKRIAPEFQADRGLHVGRPDINRLAACAEVTALEDGVVADVLVGDELREEFVAAHRHAGLKRDHRGQEVLG